MADRRMFSKTLCQSDNMLDLPHSSQSLYFHLNLAADDDGFVSSPRGIIRMIGAADSDMSNLIDSGFIFTFDSGVVLIKEWLLNNSIRSDRYKPSACVEEAKQVNVINKAYTLNKSIGIPLVDKWETSGSIDKDRLDKDRIGKDSLEEGSLSKDNSCMESLTLVNQLKSSLLDGVPLEVLYEFADMYKTYQKVEHPAVNPERLQEIANIDIFEIYNEDGDNVLYGFDYGEMVTTYKGIIYLYFEEFSDSKQCEPRIEHFFSGDIRLHRYLEYLRQE